MDTTIEKLEEPQIIPIQQKIILDAIKEQNTAFPYYTEFIARNLYDLYERACAKIQQTRGHPATEEEKIDLLSIATNGTIGDHGLTIPNLAYWGWGKQFDLREALIAVYGVNKQFAKAIVDNAVIATHSSSLASLPDVLKQGLLPQSRLREYEIPVLGEFFGNTGISENYVSFSHWDAIHWSLNYMAKGGPLTRERLLERRRVFDSEWRGQLREGVIKVELEKIDAVLKFYDKQPKTEDEELRQNLLFQNNPIVYFLRNRKFLTGEVEYVAHTDETDFYIKGRVLPGELPIVCVLNESVTVAENLIDHSGISMQVFSLEDWRESDRLLNPDATRNKK